MDIAQLGIRIDSDQAVKGAQNLDKLTVAAAKAENATQDLSVASRGVAAPLGALARGSNVVSMNARMMGMQLSQVAQQTAATGNFVSALAILLPDMALGFGVWGMAIATVASVALPTLMAAMSSTQGGAEALKDTFDSMDTAVGNYVKAVDAAIIPNDELAASYGRLSGAAEGALQAIADVSRVEAINAVSAAVQGVVDSLTEMRDYATSSDAMASTQSVLTLKDAFDMTNQQAARLRASLEDLNAAKGLEAQARAAFQVQQALLAAYGSVDAMPKPLRDATAEMGKIIQSAGLADVATGKLAMETSGVGDAARAAAAEMAGIGSAAAGVIGQVNALANQIWSVVSAGQAQKDLQNFDLAAQYANYGQGRQAAANMVNSGYSLPGAGRAKRGGGGGGGTDDFAQRLQQLTKELQGEKELTDAWYADAQKTLADRRAQEILGEQGHREALLKIEQEYHSRLQEIQAASQERRTSDMAGFFGALAGIASAGGQKMVKTVAAFEAVQGTINAYGAAVKALNTPGLTIWGRYAACASVLAAGLKGVASIRAAGGIGGGGGAAAPAAQAAPVEQNRQVTIIQGLRKDELYSGQSIFDMIMAENKLRGGIFQVMA